MSNDLKLCDCGKILESVYDSKGNKIGVQHITIEDEEYHNKYFSSLKTMNIDHSDN